MEDKTLNINFSKQEIIKLIQLNNSLRAFVGNLQTCREREAGRIEKLEKENQKLKKNIEKIKELPNCDICDANWYEGCICLKRKIKKVLADG